jgi:hypothetical protein
MSGRPGDRGVPPRARDVVRGATFAGLSALLTAVGHVAGGGTVPDLAVLVVLLPLLAVVFVSFAQRCRTTVSTVAVLGAGQLLLHTLMVLMHPASDAVPATMGGPSMVAAHAAVTLVMAVALRHADDAVAALVAALCRVLPRRLTPPPADRPLPTRAVPAPDLPARMARLFTVAHHRRGPPVGC